MTSANSTAVLAKNSMHMHLAREYSREVRTEIEGAEIQGIYEPTDCLEKKQQIARRTASQSAA